MPSALRPLTDQHPLADFESGEPSLDDGPKRRAAENQANGSSRTYVVCDGDRVVGCYRLAAGAIGQAEAPFAKRRNRSGLAPALALDLGCVAIHKSRHQQGEFSRGFIKSPVKSMTLRLMLATAD